MNSAKNFVRNCLLFCLRPLEPLERYGEYKWALVNNHGGKSLGWNLGITFCFVRNQLLSLILSLYKSCSILKLALWIELFKSALEETCNGMRQLWRNVQEFSKSHFRQLLRRLSGNLHRAIFFHTGRQKLKALGLGGDVQKFRLHRGGEGGQLGAILCKLFRLKVCIKRVGGGKKSRKYANVIYVRPPS